MMPYGAELDFAPFENLAKIYVCTSKDDLYYGKKLLVPHLPLVSIRVLGLLLRRAPRQPTGARVRARAWRMTALAPGRNMDEATRAGIE
jgi:hypothetical protein